MLTHVNEYSLKDLIEFKNISSQFISSSKNDKKTCRPKILFVTPNLPEFDLSSGDKRLYRIMSVLTPTCDVYIFTLGEQKIKYIKAFENQNIYLYRGKNHNNLSKAIPHLDALIFSWYYTLFECFELTKLFPEAKVIVYSVDVHWLREFRSLRNGGKLTQEIVVKNKEKEILAYKATDLVWAVTAQDRSEIQSEIHGCPVAIVSNIHTVDQHSYIPKKTRAVLFFGGYQQQPNLIGLKILAEKKIPTIIKEVPDAILLIAGSKAPAEIVALSEKEGIEYIGFLEEEAIPEIYKRSKLTVIPLQAGAGIKGNICEAIAYSTPVITNDIGNKGIELVHLEEGIITNSLEKVEVTPGWLMELFRAAYLSNDIGMSGSKILYPDGTLQEFGSELYANGSGRNIGKYGDPQLPEFNRLSLCGYVSGYSMFIKRSTIKKIGTFDEQFHPCYCEDSDFCYTAKEHGLATVVTPQSIVYHHEGATSGTDIDSGFKAYQKENMKKFLTKHRGKPNGIDWANSN